MAKCMLFNVNEPEEVRAAIVDHKKVVEYDIETLNREKSRGNIYVGYIVKVEGSIQAAFVEYGAERHGFLPFSEIHPDFWSRQPAGDKRPRIEDVMKKGQAVLVQVGREAVDKKGAALTTFCSLPGRYLVLMPLSQKSGMSRKIEDQSARKALRDVMKSLQAPDDYNFIVRTAGMGRQVEDLQREMDYLVKLWKTIQRSSRRGPRTGIVFQDSDLILRMIRDYYDESVKEIWVDDEETFERARDFFSAMIGEEKQGIVRLYEGAQPLFSAHGIESKIKALYDREIPLPSGGSIVIDTTEALVAIDVNSGKTQSDKGTEDTALKTNLEASTEIMRQLRLRDLGGLIVIDFIGMRRPSSIRAVERHCRQVVKHDKARVKLGRISSVFGLLTLSRQRIRDRKDYGHFTKCPVCHGSGRLPKPESVAMEALRFLHENAAISKYERIDARLPRRVTFYLLNQKRQDLALLEDEFDVQISLVPRDGVHLDLDRDFDFYVRTRPERRKKRRRKIIRGGMPEQPAQSAEATVAAPERHEVAVESEQEQKHSKPKKVTEAPARREEPVEVADPAFPLRYTQFPDLPEGLPWFIPMLSPIGPSTGYDEPRGRRRRERRRGKGRTDEQVLQSRGPAKAKRAQSDPVPRKKDVPPPPQAASPNEEDEGAQRLWSDADQARIRRVIQAVERMQHEGPKPESDSAEQPSVSSVNAASDSGSESREESEEGGRRRRPRRRRRRRGRRDREEEGVEGAAQESSATQEPSPAQDMTQNAASAKADEPSPSKKKAKSRTKKAPAAKSKKVADKADKEKPARRTTRSWGDDELKTLASLQDLPMKEARQAFEEKGFQRSASSFKNKFYQVSRGDS